MKALIIAICSLVVLLTAATIYIGLHSFDGVVVSKPYETGIAWDAIEHHKAVLGWKVSLGSAPYFLGRNRLYLSVLGPDGKTLQNATVQVRMTRPSTDALDRTYQTERQHDGRYLAVVDLEVPGAWDAVVSVTQSAEHADYTLRLTAKRTAR